jgi:hypothetical protein
MTAESKAPSGERIFPQKADCKMVDVR